MNWVTETLPRKERARRLRRRYVDLLAIDQLARQRVRADKLARLAKGRATMRRQRKEREVLAAARTIARLDEAAHAREVERAKVWWGRDRLEPRGLGKGRLGGSLGMVSVRAQWVRLLIGLEPGQWYGIGVLRQMAGKRKRERFFRATWLFLDKALNPKGVGVVRDGELLRVNGGRPVEPRYVWRLNRWGLALRAAACSGLEQINVLELDGANRKGWVKLKH